MLTGGAIAPRYKLATSIVLAAACTLWSLAKHIWVQPHPGIKNYTHFTLEAAGAILAVVYVTYRNRQAPPRALTGPSDSGFISPQPDDDTTAED